jgi:hypothetical protein
VSKNCSTALSPKILANYVQGSLRSVPHVDLEVSWYFRKQTLLLYYASGYKFGSVCDDYFEFVLLLLSHGASVQSRDTDACVFINYYNLTA